VYIALFSIGKAEIALKALKEGLPFDMMTMLTEL
jgi:hypothetical protein